MKLHLGCGRRILEEYVNIDIQGACDVNSDIRNLPYADASVSEIYACHVLEHFGRHEVMGVLSEWARVIEDGGSIYLAVPDIDSAISYYTKNGDLSLLYGQFWGGQKDMHDYHKIGFTFKTLESLLLKNGFENVSRYDAFTYLPKDFDDYSKSYLPHMDFSGHLLSLNVSATKRK